MRRYPLITFFVLAYALAWWIWILYAFDITFLGPIFALGPFLAAIIVTAVTRRTAGLKALLSRMVRWRVGLGLYAAALLLPVAIYLFAVSLNILLGARASTAEQFGSWYLIFPLFAYSLLFPLSGAFGEELGWRGYALPRAQARVSALSAALIIGVIQTAWHLPLFIIDRSTPPVPLIVGYMGLGILATWVFNNTRGSVLMTMLLHASFNTNAGSSVKCSLGRTWSECPGCLPRGGAWLRSLWSSWPDRSTFPASTTGRRHRRSPRPLRRLPVWSERACEDACPALFTEVPRRGVLRSSRKTGVGGILLVLKKGGPAGEKREEGG